MPQKSILPRNMSEKSIVPVPQNMSANSIIPLISKMLGGISVAQMGSSLAGMMFILATLQQFCPNIVQEFLNHLWYRLDAFFRPQIQITFYEYSAYSFKTSDAYRAVEAYVGMLSMDATNNATRLKGDKADKKSPTQSLIFVLEDFEEITDCFEGVNFTWLLGKLHPKTKSISHCPWAEEKRFFRLTFKKKYRRLVTAKYLTHVIETGETVLKKRRTRMLYTNNASKDWEDYKRGIWRKCVFEHSATFENLAMEPSKKDEIIQDLITFTKAKDYYLKIGKAWKRGYLLYGPPGTGKTTMIACMANLLGYDVYDLELTTIKNNSQLRNLLISTTGKSIILIEDIDCTLPITSKRDKVDNNAKASGDGEKKKTDDSEKKKTDDSEKKSDDVNESESDSDSESESESESDSESNESKASDLKTKVTLSGLLNIIDGLWSPCSEERIIVFTTNHISKLDPALIRTGRMDKHIEMSYCTFAAFKIFAKNYLNIDAHPLFDKIEKLLSEVNIGPSDVAENLLPKSIGEDPERRLEALIAAIEEKSKKRRKSAKLEEQAEKVEK